MKQPSAASGLLVLALLVPARAQAVPAPAPALAPVAPLPPTEFHARRMALAERIAERHPGRRAVVIVRGGPARADMGAFVQDQDFLYLTGVSEPDIAMLMTIDASGRVTRDELLVPPYSPFAARWDGSFLAPGEATAKATGFAEAGNVRALLRRLDELFADDGDQRPMLVAKRRPAARIGSTPSKASEAHNRRRKDAFDKRSNREQLFVEQVATQQPGIEVVELERFVHEMRPYKSDGEVARIEACSRIAAAGIGEAMKSCRVGAFEYQLAAVARCWFSLHGCGPDAYAAIVGAGPNGCVLHYSACTRQLQQDDLIVMDYAATLHGYASDVTRTFPASGTFTAAQRALVQDVYEVQQELIAMVKPGAKLSELYAACAQKLVARGYKNEHGPCHHVGLAVHDPSVDVLAPGMVLTVEPGAYLDDKGYGCRIEDCVLVTADGCRVLSDNVPSRPDDVEAWMKQPATIVIP